MWQRIQTLFLALALGLVAALFFCVKAFSIGQGGVHAQEATYVQSFPYLVLLVVASILQLISLAAYRVRVFQMRTALLAGIILLALQCWLAYDYFTAPSGVVFSFTAIFPLLAAICDFLAARFILRDQLLVESATRLRSRKKNRKF